MCLSHNLWTSEKPVWKKENRIKRKKQANESKILKNKDKIKEYNEKYSGQGKIRKTDTKRRKQKDKATQRIRENKKLNKDNRTLQKEYEEYEDYNKRISEIFQQDTIKKRKKKIQHTKQSNKSFTGWNKTIYTQTRKRFGRNTRIYWKWKHSQNQQLVRIILQNSFPQKISK